MQLEQLQLEFAASLLDHASHISSRLGYPESRQQELLEVYRGNFIISLTEVLQASYPATQTMVGDEFFEAAARQFILQTPLEEGSVTHFGEGFGQFIATLPGLRDMPWLPELARLEWQLDAMSLAELPIGDFPIQQLAQVKPQDYPKLKFHLSPACQLFSSTYGVASVWKMAKLDETLEVQLNEACHLMLVKQRDFRVLFISLNDTEFSLLQGFSSQQPLGAIEQADELERYLPRFVELGYLSGFSI
ncbi:HvfC/BufC family peptide modification chaperone [Dongshaea marina]|uniref:HvfC/BufC family peptide modification chaperone n=1 Tax=Dongshaea marina TaxID=2047966 RepID=UPI000D3E65DD|nr:putative DNA-binding domain-containing protein [Dongshaea marina]